MLSETRSRGWLFNKRKSQEAHLIGLLRLSFSFPLVPLPYLWWSHKDFLIQLRLRRKNVPWIKILFINMLSLSHKAGKSPWNKQNCARGSTFSTATWHSPSPATSLTHSRNRKRSTTTVFTSSRLIHRGEMCCRGKLRLCNAQLYNSFSSAEICILQK